MTNMRTEEAFEVAGGREDNPLILLCDHASNRVPEAYDGLVIAPAQFERHIAYDIGARDVTLGLADKLRATAVLSRFSRLLIDPNRGMDDPTLIMRISDGAVVPGNRHVDEGERTRRIKRYFLPYHEAVAGEIARVKAAGLMPFLVSIHSFTPAWRGVPRPWHVGILWDRDEKVAKACIQGFEKQGDLVVGDNEPYHGALEGDTLNTHGTKPGLPHVLIEIRQDLIAAKSGVDEWVERVAKVIGPIMKELQSGRPFDEHR
jgi:predicted N-formylglutamate amidohydrolase